MKRDIVKSNGNLHSDEKLGYIPAKSKKLMFLHLRCAQFVGFVVLYSGFDQMGPLGLAMG